MTISDQKSYIKIETLRGKNPTEIHSALSEVCGDFTVDCSTVSRWASSGCVNIDNDPRPGRREYQQMKEVWSFWQMLLKKIVVQHVKNFLEPREQKLCRKMHKNQTQLLMAQPLILHDNTHLHIVDVVIKNFSIMGGKCYTMRRIVQIWVYYTSTYSQS